MENVKPRRKYTRKKKPTTTACEPTVCVEPASKEATLGPPEYIDPEAGVMRLTESELLRMARYDAEVRAGEANVRFLHIQREAYIKAIDPHNRLAEYASGIEGHRKAAEEARTKLRQEREAIEARLNISLRDYAWDDETGVIHEVPAAAEAASK